MVFTSMHLLKDDLDGKSLLELLQQRAEQWCASGLCTVVFNSDDYWVYERLKEHATRMEVLPVKDLTKGKSMAALTKFRANYFRGKDVDLSLLEQVYDRVGGRLSFLNRVAKAEDMLAYCDEVCKKEKTWFLNQCWLLGEEMDDDVMDQQKYAVSQRSLLPKKLSVTNKDGKVGGNGPSQSPRRQRKRARRHVRPRARLGLAGDTTSRGAPDYDACGLHSEL